MQFTTHLKISPNYEEGVFPADRMPSRSATNTSLRDGSILYLMGRTVLCKYDVSDASEPRLLKKVDVAASHPTEDTTDYINKYNAHSTAILDIGKYLAVSLRGGGGGVKNMADGVVVGAVVVIDKESLTVVKELCFENRVTYINRYENLLIVSLHFHGFYIYEITDDEIISCVCKHIEEEKPRKATTREFQNCAVFDAEDGKINISFASYLYGICTYTYDKRAKAISYCCELNPKAFPDTYDPKSGVTNTVFGLTSKGGFVYGGITPGNNRFRPGGKAFRNLFDKGLEELNFHLFQKLKIKKTALFNAFGVFTHDSEVPLFLFHFADTVQRKDPDLERRLTGEGVIVDYEALDVPDTAVPGKNVGLNHLDGVVPLA